MGNRHSKSTLRNAIIYLNISADPIDLEDEKFWSQIWSEDIAVAGDVIKSISTQEIRMLRDGSPKNFASLIYKMVERLHLATGTLCNTNSQQTAVINASKILIRCIPCIFEDRAWQTFLTKNDLHFASANEMRDFELIYPKKDANEKNYKAYLPFGAAKWSLDEDCADETGEDFNVRVTNLIETIDNDLVKDNSSFKTEIVEGQVLFKSQVCSNLESVDRRKSLLKLLILAICDLLFCPEFTVTPHTDKYLNSRIDAPPEDLKSLPTCDYVWEPGVGFESSVNSTTYFDKSRSELLRLLLVCMSSTLYRAPSASIKYKNQCLEIFASQDNRHALPLFTSLLNVVFNYIPSKSLPLSHLISSQGMRDGLVELSLQVLIVTLDYQFDKNEEDKPPDAQRMKDSVVKGNLFIEYMSRIHKDEDFNFIIRGFIRLLNNRLESQSYLLGYSKHVNFEHELLVLFWRICNVNKKFVNYLLRRNEVLDIVTPILYHLNENFQDASKTGIIHIGIFNLLILSGEREFGVKLNRPYQNNAMTKLPAFSGSHADLIIIVFHKLILYGQNLHQLFDFLLTIVVNISPYLKGLTMMASKCLIQIFEIFSSSFVIFTEPNHHQLVIFLLEIFNNLVQYQFDSNANLVYAIINKKDIFQNLVNLPTSDRGIRKVLSKLIRKKQKHDEWMEKISVEQNFANLSSVSTNGSSSGSTIQRCNQSDSSSPSSLTSTFNYSTQLGATVSSVSNNVNHSSISGCRAHNQQESQFGSVKQGISLVATPDIYRVTHPIHPFDTDNESTPQIFFGSNVQSAVKQAISFDEISDQTSTHSNNPTPEPRSLTDSRKLNSVAEITQDLDESVFFETSKHCESAGNAEFSAKRADVIKSTSEDENKKWKPTPEWVKEWKQSLPLHTSLRMIEVLAPQLDRLKQDLNKQQIDEIDMIKFLQEGTLVGLLPVPHSILIRKYYTNDETTLWFRACTWGIIYIRNTMWADTNTKLIKIV